MANAETAQAFAAADALIARAIRQCRRAGWNVTAAHLRNDQATAGRDLRELLIVRDFAQEALDSLAANGFQA